ncbi:MAG: DUF1844 domain-containing protein [Nitrospirae bacterium]|nr:DUF1844 domain-containing protein [Nitrospirota bacterium]
MTDESPFTIRDRRRSQEESPLPASSDPPPVTAPFASPDPAGHGEAAPHAVPPRASFSELLFSLGTSAFAALGVQSPGEDAGGNPSVIGEGPIDLQSARHLIDLLEIVERKTAGNLTPDEQHLLQQLLYTLRLTFVERSRSGPVAPPGGAR